MVEFKHASLSRSLQPTLPVLFDVLNSIAKNLTVLEFRAFQTLFSENFENFVPYLLKFLM
jgi:hypothetical protein